MFSEKSRVLSNSEYFEILYKSNEADAILTGFSIEHSDPDGLYHKLGKFGAIKAFLTLPDETSELLEIGRKLIKKEEIEEIYEKVTISMLGNVSLIHLGYSRAIAAYRNDKLIFKSNLLKRTQGQISGFKVKQ